MLYSSALMGNHFRDAFAKESCTRVQIGDKMTLHREPTNPYDANAIQVHFHDPVFDDLMFLGYVERGLAEEIAPLIDNGAVFEVQVVGFLAPNKPYLDIRESE